MYNVHEGNIDILSWVNNFLVMLLNVLVLDFRI